MSVNASSLAIVYLSMSNVNAEYIKSIFLEFLQYKNG